MTQDPHQILKEITPTKPFFVGIDSDGCVFDTMEIKHKECFCPNFIRYWELQNISKYARETWDFVNLYSQTRGCNRFHAVIESIRLLSERKEVKARGAKLPDVAPLIEWVKKETKLGNPALERYAKDVHNPVIDKTLAWSKAVNTSIGEFVYGIPPFPWVRESLLKFIEQADVIVVSQTPGEALNREWVEHHIDQYVRIICGQEYGTKTEHIRYAADGKYPRDKMLMIGDAPGDMQAAKSNGAMFFPINPGHEEDSWERLYKEGIDRFFSGSFGGPYENSLIEEFNKCLPSLPAWNS
ncbi:MAG: HAD family hydrolase [Ignavibacteriae bacterium]|nr:MAG: HAD family hydrolase [Ignavibacteriota bacterium]